MGAALETEVNGNVIVFSENFGSDIVVHNNLLCGIKYLNLG